MNKNNLTFSESLKEILATTPATKILKLDTILAKLRSDGQTEEADSILQAIKDKELPLYTIYKALRNSGIEISYSALNTARARYLQDAE
tara:strand:- start:1236 stop:1502 length:267 start_codon:yes stop_codon:yes gene_type:complete